MKTIKTLLVAMMMVVPVLVVGGTAGAGVCDSNPDHWKCSDPPSSTTTTTIPDGDVLGGYTCAEMGFVQATHGLEFSGGGFSFTLSGRSDDVCIDVMSDGPARWEVTVTPAPGSGTVRSMQLIPRDSYAPGDSCGGVDYRGSNMPDLPVTQELPHPDDDRVEIPAATVNACGTQFGEWIDGVNVVEQTGDPHPLVFIAAFTGARDAEVTVTVDCGTANCSAP